METEKARQALKARLDNYPTDFFQANPNLQRLLRMYLGDAGYDTLRDPLSRLGRACATVIDEAATINDQLENHPRLERYDSIGERTEAVKFHPSYHAAGRPAYESGVLAIQAEPGHAVQQAAMLFLLAHCGEMGHTCPIVCTAGLIRALQQKGDDFLKQTFLPPLLVPDYDRRQHGAQFITEVQGGSDVGANACQATPTGTPGVWRIDGEKWFCSNINADQFLVTARPSSAGEGTRGLGLFLVPRRLPESGVLNGFHIRRLKSKFGTRTMASAEVDFVNATAYQVGEVADGFKTLMETVINTSRWLNAAGSMGLLSRAWIEAFTFAEWRRAFGHDIRRYPLVQEALAEIKTGVYAGMASTFRLSHLIDRLDTGAATPQEQGFYRLLVNINKYWTSLQASLAIRRAQEILGGNGAIEDFSIVPRLYRDAVVFESWEGSHNVLCLQVLKDMQKYNLHVDFVGYIGAQLDRVTHPALLMYQQAALDALERLPGRWEQLRTGGPDYAQTHIRRVVEQMAALVQATCLVVEAEWEMNQGLGSDKREVLAFHVQRYLTPRYDPMGDAAYQERLERICQRL
jgi:alkylation response protein AidB-like acyl-CoA dehydrogenase